MRKYKLLFAVLLMCAPMCVSMWAASSQVRRVAVLDMPGRPGFDQMAFAQGLLIIAHPGANTVDIFDPIRRRVIGTVKDMSSPRGITVSEDQKFVYITNFDANNIVELDTQDWQVRRTIPVNGQPESVVAVPNTHLLLVTLPEQRQVAAVDLARGHQVAQTDVEGRPECLAFDVGRNVAYATVQDRKEIIEINPQMRIARRMPVNGSLPTGLVYDHNADRLYVAVRYAVLTLDPSTGGEVGRVPASGGVDGLWLDRQAQHLYAMSNGSLFIMKAGARLGQPAEVDVEVKGHTVAYDPVKDLIYVPGGREGRAKLLILKQNGPVQPTQNAQQQGTKPSNFAEPTVASK